VTPEENGRWSAVDVVDRRSPTEGRPRGILSIAETDPAITNDRAILAMSTGRWTLDASDRARLALQAIVVMLAALLVGLAVFATVKAVVGSGDGDPGVADGDADDQVVAPGPGDPGDNSRFGSKRTSVDSDSARFGPGTGTGDPGGDEDGRTGWTGGGSDRAGRAGSPAPGSAGDPIGAVEGPTEPGTGTASRASGAIGLDDPLSAGATATSAAGAVLSVPAPASPTTVANGATNVTSGSGGSAPGPPRTQPTTPAPTTATTTGPTSTSPPVRSADLLVTPTPGTVLTWEAPTRLRATEVPGAVRYCWTLQGARSARSCDRSPTFELPGGRRNLGPGPVTLVVEAVGRDRTTLLTQEISLTLLARDFVKRPTAGAGYGPGDKLVLSATKIPAATGYCWTVVQGSLSSGEVCSDKAKLDLTGDGAPLAGCGSGPANVRAVVYGGDVVLGRQSVVIELTGR
jgi:hypothetical protein